MQELLPSCGLCLNVTGIRSKKRGKPSSHLKALADLTDDTIKSDCPQPLRDLIGTAEKLLHARSKEDAPED
jgi:hypothetical protein